MSRVVKAASARQFILDNAQAWGTRGLPEQSLIDWARQFLKPGRLFLDIGAHCGTWAMQLASEDTPTFAYEPERSAYYRLCGAIALNRLEDHVTAVHAALGSAPGEADLNVVENKESERSSLSPRPDDPVVRRERVPVHTLDGERSHYPLPVGLIKIDVEGTEQRVLEGATELLAIDQPVVLVECLDTPARARFFTYVQKDLRYHIVPIAQYPEMWALLPRTVGPSDAEPSVPSSPLQDLAAQVPKATSLWGGTLTPFGLELTSPRSDVALIHSIPSICVDPMYAELWCSIRWINYTNDEHWICFDSDGIVRSIGELVRLDHVTLEVLERRLLTLSPEVEAQHPRHPSWTRGFEDLRLVRLPDGWAATATATDWNPHSQSEMFLLRITVPAKKTDTGDAKIERVVRLIPPRAERDGRTQKNWVPIHDEDAASLFYAYRTGVLIYEDGEPASEPDVLPPVLAKLRGSSQALALSIEHGGGWLYVTHDDHPPAHHGRAHTVTHRLVRLDADRRTVAVSPRFCFFAPGVEYCAGLARVGDELLFSLAAREQHLWMHRAPLAAVLATLVPCDEAAE